MTVYERDDHPGGLTMYGIPNMKLPKEIVARRVKIMEEVGVKFVLNTEVGVDVSGDELKREYQRIVLAIGARQARDLNVPGRELEGVRLAVDYLTDATKSWCLMPLIRQKAVWHYLRGCFAP